MATKNLIIRGGADFSKVKKELQNTQKSLEKFQNNVSSTMKKIGAVLGTLAVGKLIKDSTSMAMGVESAVDNINRNMGSAAETFQDFVRTQSQALGMAEADAYRYGSTFSNLLSSFTESSQETAKQTQDLMKAAAVIASKTGRSYEDVSERIRSGMLGSTEAIEDLGVYTNISMIESTNAFRKFAGDKSWAQLDFQTQQQIRLAAILEQTYDRYGDTLADTTQTRHAQLIASLKNVQLSIGQAFLPIYNAVLPALTAFANAIGRVVNIIAQFTSALFGAKQAQEQAKAVNSQASAVQDLGKSYTKAGKAAKKASGSVAGFDEVNTLADKSSSGSGSGPLDEVGMAGGGAIPFPELDNGGFINGTLEVSEKVREMADKVKGAFGTLKDFFITYKDEITAIMAGIAVALTFALIATNWSSIIEGIKLAFLGLRGAIVTTWAAITGPIGLIALAIAGLVAGFVYFYNTNDKFRGFVQGIFTSIKNVLVDLWNNVLVPLGKFLGTVFVAAWDKVQVGLEWLWKNVLVPIGSFIGGAFIRVWNLLRDAGQEVLNQSIKPLSNFLKTFWNDVLVPIGNVLKDVLAVAFNFVAEVAKDLWQNVLIPLGEFFVAIFEPTIDAVSAVLTYLWKNVFVPLGTLLGGIFIGIWKDLTKVIEFLWHNVLKPLVPFLKDVLSSAFTSIGDVINGLKQIFIGLMDWITGVFTGDWEKAWNGVKSIFKGIFDSLFGIVKLPLNLIIDGINSVIRGLNSLSIDIPDWVPGFGGQTWGVNIPKIPKLARGGIVTSPTVAMIGEAGTEAVVPLENTAFVDTLASALGSAVMSAMQFSSGGSSEGGDTILQIDGQTIGRILGPLLDNEKQRVGGSLIIQTT